MTMISASVPLLSGHQMPIVGLGTWQSTPAEIKKAIDAALEMGYRHIDTAFMYQNETSIGDALKPWLESGRVKREELFITTKLPLIAMRPERIAEYVGKSLAALQLDYLDCYLIHSPIGLNNTGDDTNVWPIKDGTMDLDMTTDLVAIWHEFEKEIDAGRIRTIGVSNFSIEQLSRVNAAAKKYKIQVQQVELHAQFQQKEMREFCSQNGIVIMAYAPLGSPNRPTRPGVSWTVPGLLDNEEVKSIAWGHRVTPAQVLLHHLAQKGIVVIPKSVTPARIQVNYQIFNFKLTPEEMETLDSIDIGEEGRTFLGIPGMDAHPESQLAKRN